nr:MAG TPA: hypothetical protein [Caudoviricetes sp.]
MSLRANRTSYRTISSGSNFFISLPPYWDSCPLFLIPA